MARFAKLSLLKSRCREIEMIQSCSAVILRFLRIWPVALVLIVHGFASLPVSADATLWEQVKNGKLVVLMRHAIAPGNGDPNNFTLGVCETQRNLSQEGREQATRIGKVFKDNGIDSASVFTSQWCRCVDTATQLQLGSPEVLPMINSFYQDRSTRDQQTSDAQKFIVSRLEKAKNDPTLLLQQKVVVLVTHQVNITALTNVFPQSGEMVFVGLQEGNVVVAGTVATE